MFKHKKYLGQNFIINKNITKKIAEIGIINKDSNILEVGPGSGVLTQELIKKDPKKIFAIEFDKDLKPELEKIKNNFNNFDYIISDALTFDERKIFKKNFIPFRVILIDQKKPTQNLISLIVYSMMETVILCKALDLNPFNQPAVEAIKKETYSILS